MVAKYYNAIKSLFVPDIEDKSQNLYRYGKDNLLPQKLIRYINDSGVAKACAVKIKTYIAADGFASEVTKKFKVNPKQTADEMLAMLSWDLSYFKSFALSIGRDRSGKIVWVKHVPFQIIRKTLRGDFWINPTYGSSEYKKEKGSYYPKFKGIEITPDDLAKQIQDYGDKPEILYVYEPTPDNPHYPVPDYYAGIEDFRTSSRIQQFDLNMVLNGFKPTSILTLVGVTDDSTKDERGKTQRDYLYESLEPFTGNAPNADGETSEGGLLVLEAKTKDEIPNLQTFDIKAILDSSNTKREVVDRAICRHMKVNPVLVGFSDAVILGNTQSIANASMELNNNVNGYQQMIERTFAFLFPALDWTITKFTPVNYIPDSIMQDLTQTERRALFGYPELIVEGSDNKPLLAEKLGVGGTQSFTAILADPNLSNVQKRSALEILFGLDSQTALRLVPEPTTIAP